MDFEEFALATMRGSYNATGRILLSSENNSDNGYEEEGAFMRSLLVLSHALMLPSLYVLWPARTLRPIVVLAIFWSFVFSSQYHLCYSFDKCLFSVKENNRLYDYVFSPMILGVMFTTFAFPLVPEGGKPTPASASALADNVVGINAFSICLYVIHVYLYVYVGATPTSSIVVPLSALLPIGIVFAYNYGAVGIVVRIAVFAVALSFELLAYAGYWLGDYIGSFSHTLWHALSFVAMYVFFRLGPILAPYRRDYYMLEAGILDGAAVDPCCGARYADEVSADDNKLPRLPAPREYHARMVEDPDEVYSSYVDDDNDRFTTGGRPPTQFYGFQFHNEESSTYEEEDEEVVVVSARRYGEDLLPSDTDSDEYLQGTAPRSHQAMLMAHMRKRA